MGKSTRMDIKNGKELIKIGLNVAYYRKLRCLSQDELAEKSKISRQQLTRIESANIYANPTTLTMVKLAKTLNVPLYYLYEYKSDEDKTIKQEGG